MNNNFSDDLLTVITLSQTSTGSYRWAFGETCVGNSLDKSVIVWSRSANHLRSNFSSLLILKRLIFFQITNWSTGAAILDLSGELSFDWSISRLHVITWSSTGGGGPKIDQSDLQTKQVISCSYCLTTTTDRSTANARWDDRHGEFNQTQ